MPKFSANPFSKGGIPTQIFEGSRKIVQPLLTGTPEKRENVSTLRPEQEPLYQQAVNAGLGSGAGGAFGDAADYYRGLMGNNSSDFDAFAAPERRNYFENIVPNISEQFAGMGAGGLSSSGFQNSQTQGSVDLADRLAQLRAGLRQSGAQGLQNIGKLGLQNYSQNMVTQEGSEGLLSQLAPAIGIGLGAAAGGPAGGAAAAGLFNGAKSWMGKGGGGSVGRNSSPYGGSYPQASPRQLPNFLDNSGR